MRLIDADAYLKKLKADPLYPLIEKYGVEGTIEAMPTIDAELIRQGHWIKVGCSHFGIATYECSVCHYADEHNESCEVPYCWQCGARMHT